MGRTLGAFCFAACAAIGCTSSPEGAPASDDLAAGGKADQVGGAADAGQSAPLRFVAMGDTGKGNDIQRQVAIAARDLCEAEGCDFVLLLGDNLYPAGAKTVDDAVWQSAFEDPYRDIDLPFYAVLGNHDYGGKIWFINYGGLGNQFERGPVEVAYSQQSAKWRMPATHYTLRFGPVGVIAVDTNSILWDNQDHGDQWAWFPDALDQMADATWVLTVGHHPYRSNGAHGDAGSYESLLDLTVPIDQLDGEEVEQFIGDLVCGNADLYLSAHDHNRQWLSDPSACGGTELVVSGSGAYPKELDDPERNPVYYQEDTTAGFLYVVVDGPTLTGRFVDLSGAVGFERTLRK